MIWTVIEWIAILAECFMVARLMIRYFGFRSPEKRLLKWGILVGILVCIDALGSFLIQNEIILVAGFVLTNFIYAAILLRGNFLEKMVVAAISYMLFYFINLPVLTVLSSLSESAPAEAEKPVFYPILWVKATPSLYFHGKLPGLPLASG